MTAGQVRVDVLRAPINPSDLIQVSGSYGVRPDLPAIPGNEGLGRIVEGEGKGQLVLLPAGHGTWSSEIACNPKHLMPLRQGDLDQLSVLVVNPPTVHLLMKDFVGPKKGDWMTQSAANSAVGGYINQLPRESAVSDVEADVALIDGPDLARDVRKATGTKMRLAVDAVGGETTGRLAATLETGGTLVNYGGMSNQDCQISASALIFNNIFLRGFWLVTWMHAASKTDRQAHYRQLTAPIIKGDLHAPIDRNFTLDQIAEAANHSWTGARKGKVMLAPNGV